MIKVIYKPQDMRYVFMQSDSPQQKELLDLEGYLNKIPQFMFLPSFRGKKPDLIMLFTDGYVNKLPRNKRTMNNLIWCIIDNPSFNVKHNDSLTKVIHINSADIK